MNYATSEAVSIALTIRYDNAVQTQGDTLGTAGVGQRIGRIVADAAAQGIATGIGSNTPS